MHSILIIGQSNMAGRGFIGEVAPIQNEKIFVLRNGRWQGMFVPVNPDRSFSGINLSESFADLYAKERNTEIGIIPCADGGTHIEQWQPGELLFDHACFMAELASRTSEIVAVLWHQGESDCHEERYPVYEEKLIRVLNAFREKLNLQDVPFLIGGLGDFLKNCDESISISAVIRKNYTKINETLKNVADKLPMTGFVSAEGLGANPDNLHFSAIALREFGERYYNEFTKIESRNKKICDKDDKNGFVQSEIEKL